MLKEMTQAFSPKVVGEWLPVTTTGMGPAITTLVFLLVFGVAVFFVRKKINLWYLVTLVAFWAFSLK